MDIILASELVITYRWLPTRTPCANDFRNPNNYTDKEDVLIRFSRKHFDRSFMFWQPNVDMI